MALLGPDGNPSPAPSPAPDTATEEQTPEVPDAPARVVTAFLVFQLPTGQWIASEDFLTPINPSRKATPDDIVGGSENVKAQTIARQAASMAASMTVQTQMAMAAQFQNAEANRQVAAALARDGHRPAGGQRL